MSREWRESLGNKLEEFVDSLVINGAKQSEIFDAIIDEIANLRAAYERDPDPADDKTETKVTEEPSNDWPGATR